MNLMARASHLLSRWEPAFALKQELDMLPGILARRSGTDRSWSQFGEDEIFCRELADIIHSGYYLEIGANHPAKISNTYRLYCKGMRGITIEPDSILSKLHEKYRPGDIQLCAGASDKDGLSDYYRISPHVLSTFSNAERELRLSQGERMVSHSLKPVFTVSTILAACSFPDRPIFALLSVDTEGLDEMVLRSNDWSTYRPRIISVENNEKDSRLRSYLAGVGYARIATSGCNEIYKISR